MPDIFGNKLRQGNQGRIPDSGAGDYEKFKNFRITMPPDIYARLEKYCDEEERAKSWVIQKAVDAWLKKEGY